MNSKPKYTNVWQQSKVLMFIIKVMYLATFPNIGLRRTTPSPNRTDERAAPVGGPNVLAWERRFPQSR